jgi:hypothetical protein
MVSFAVKLILLLLLAPCFLAYEDSSSLRNGKFHYTHNGQQLNKLYNQPIKSIQEYSRPLDIPGGKFLDRFGINHRGQVATMGDGKQFLVHKGPDFGINSQTVVVDRKYMSKNWSPRGSSMDHSSGNTVRLGDLVKSGGAHYNSICSNCIHASNRMKERFQNGK